MQDTELELSQERFDQRARRTSIVTTVAFHLGALMLMWFWTCTLPPEPQENLTEITWGGGGGAPGFDGPEGPAMRGEPTPNPQPQSQPTVSAAEKSRPTPAQTPKTVEAPKTSTPSSEHVQQQSEKHTEAHATPTPATHPTTSHVQTPPSTNDQSEGTGGGQNPEGTGDRPASGSGGPGVGHGVGVGIGGGVGSRGWIRRPSASGENLGAEGTVQLSFTVLPDGSITNIRPLSRPNASLVNRAVQGLSAARARPLPDSAPQTSETYTITFTFYLR